mgnify:FL=1
MGMSRITITLDDETLSELRDRAPKGEVSAYVLEAIRSRLRRDPIVDLLDQLDEVYGASTPADLDEGRQWWESINQSSSSTAEPSSP